jgi:RAB protein geranylgeranyltransferase component A
LFPQRALSRAKKNVLHVDPAGYYGGPEAALTLQEAEAWAATYAAPFEAKADDGTSSNVFGSAAFTTTEFDTDKGSQLASSRAYAIALAPQIVHGRSELVSQLVSSRAFRQLEFLAVGSFYIFDQSSSTLTRVPSTREDVFATTAIAARSKRALMKFLKFVLEHESEPNFSAWQPYADQELSAFLADPATGFRLDKDLQAYVIAMTLSTDGRISVIDGLRTLHRHLTSMGTFGPGFAAVYPKWGGISEISQVACRAGAVGGAVYMLGMGTRGMVYGEAEAERGDAPARADVRE